MIKILLVEDDADRYFKLLSWLPEDTRILLASCPNSAFTMLKADKGKVYAGIMLDYDLVNRNLFPDQQPYTGGDVARHIIKYIHYDTPILVHSMNHEKRGYVVDLLGKACFNVTQIPMNELTEKKFNEWLVRVREVHLAREEDRLEG